MKSKQLCDLSNEWKKSDDEKFIEGVKQFSLTQHTNNEPLIVYWQHSAKQTTKIWFFFLFVRDSHTADDDLKRKKKNDFLNIFFMW